MTHTLTQLPPQMLKALRQSLILIVAGLFLSIFWADDAKANVVCHVDDVGLDFGSSDVGTGTINFTCTNYTNAPVSMTVCASRGNPSWPGSNNQPVLRLNSEYVDFNVYIDPSHSQVWTQNNPIATNLTIAAGNGISASGSMQFYGQIAPGQSPLPALYQAFFYNTMLGILRNGNCHSNGTGQQPFSGHQFTLPVLALIANSCTVTALGAADLGLVPAGPAPVSGSTAISVNCPTGTAYNIGLRPSNGDSAGLGVLTGTGSNLDQPPYQLRSTSPTGPIWGNTASVSGVGNGVSGTGNGADQTFPVYVTMPDSDYTPDTYRDTVRVTVHY